MYASINPLDPTDLTAYMRYFPRISQNSLKIPMNFLADIQIQIFTKDFLFIKTKSLLLRLKENFKGFNLIYWNPMGV